MNHLIAGRLLLAEGDPFRGLSGGFKPEENHYSAGSVVVVLLVFFAFIALLWFLARLADRRRRRGPSNNPRLLLITLGRAHGLRWTEILFLWRMARWHRLKDPARILLEPDRWDSAAGGRLLSHRLEGLKGRLFAGLSRSGSVAAAGRGPGAAPTGQGTGNAGTEAKAVPFPFLASPLADPREQPSGTVPLD